MRKYKCWVDGRKEQTVCFITAETGFAARMKLANKHNVRTIDCVSVWQRDDISVAMQNICAAINKSIAS